jgi:outer membrane protein insertion porin family
VKVGATFGQRSRGVDFSFTDPYFLGYRFSAGFDLFSRYTDSTQTSRYESRTTGGSIRFGLPVTDDFGVGIRYSIFTTKINVPNTSKQPFGDCSIPIPGITPNNLNNPADFLTKTFNNNCLTNGEASLAVKEAQGSHLTSLVGLSFVYNTLDNAKDPTSGWLAEFRPDVAGLGGDSRYVRATADVRYYYPVTDDVVAILRGQAGHIRAFGNDRLRLTDHFNLGPSLVRGFATGGIGPRDVSYDAKSGSVGGTTYFGLSAEVQFPIWGLPRELGLRGAVFADAGSLFNYSGYRAFNLNGNKVVGVNGAPNGGCIPTNANTGVLATAYTQGNCLQVQDRNTLRSSVGASILWQSPLGPIRFDYAYALTKDRGEYDARFPGIRIGGDRTQAFRFSGGGRF